MPQWLSEPHVTMLRLDRMGREQCHAIISEVIGNNALPREAEEQIIDRADGVPLFVEELTKSVLESQLVQDVGDRHIAVGGVPSLAVPASLVDSLTARLDRLGPAKEIAQIGAVIGREFSHPLLTAATPEIGQLRCRPLSAQLRRFRSDLRQRRGAPNSTYTFRLRGYGMLLLCHAVTAQTAATPYTYRRCSRQIRASCACSFPAKTRRRSSSPPRPELWRGAAFASSRLRPISSVPAAAAARLLI